MSHEKAVMDIEELSITMSFADRTRAESLTAAAFQADVAFDYQPEEKAILSGPWEDAVEGNPAQLNITSIKLAQATVFIAVGMTMWIERGYEVMGFFSVLAVEKLEEKLLERAQQGDE